MSTQVRDEGVPGSESLRTSAFVSLCAVIGFGYLHQGITLVMVPLYVVALGHSETAAGILVAIFSLASVVVRPAWGRVTDATSARGTVFVGTVVCAAAALLHMATPLWLLGVAAVARGVGWGAVNTGGNAALAAATPPARRGLGSSIYNIFQNTGMAIAPAVGLLLLGITSDSYALVFGVAALLMVAAAVAVPRIAAGRPKEAQDETDGRGPGHVAAASRPSLLVGIFMLTQPAMIIFVPLFAMSIGIPAAHMSWYYVALGAFGVLVRVLLGPTSDRFGRDRIILTGFVIATAAIVVMSWADALAGVILAGLAYTVGQALVIPATTAMAMDRVPVGGAGRVMGLFTAAFQVGMGIGSFVVALLADHLGYQTMFHVVAAVAAVVVIGLFLDARAGRHAQGEI